LPRQASPRTGRPSERKRRERDGGSPTSCTWGGERCRGGKKKKIGLNDNRKPFNAHQQIKKGKRRKDRREANKYAVKPALRETRGMEKNRRRWDGRGSLKRTRKHQLRFQRRMNRIRTGLWGRTEKKRKRKPKCTGRPAYHEGVKKEAERTEEIGPDRLKPRT